MNALHKTCAFTLTSELKAFYQGTSYPKEKLNLDSDILQGVLIYLVSRSHYPQLWTELTLCEEYLCEGLMMSARAYYLVMAKASCEYLLKLDTTAAMSNTEPPTA